MHLYMHNANITRFRCRNYPRCKTYVKVENTNQE